ncbi:MAG: hypothetical protein AAGE52_13720 [Myxococcota bacterium]
MSLRTMTLRGEAKMDDEVVPERNVFPWVMLVVLLLIAGGIAAFLLIDVRSAEPTRVVVVGNGAPGLQPIEENVVELLREAGLDALSGEPIDTLDGLAARAETAEAAHAVWFSLDTQPEREGLVEGSTLYRTELQVHISTDGDMQDPLEVEFTFERTSSDDAVRRVAGTWVDYFVPLIVDRLVNSASLGGLIDGDPTMDQLAYVRLLRQARPQLEGVRDRTEAYEEFCQSEADALEALGEEGVECTGDPCGQWTMLGVTADGSHAIVQDLTRRPMFGFQQSRFRWLEPPESVARLELASGERQSLVRAGHFYGFGDLTADRRRMGVSFFGTTGSLGIVVLDVEDGSWKQKVMLGPRERSYAARPSPEGDEVLIQLRNEGWWIMKGTERTPLPGVSRARWILHGGVPHVVARQAQTLVLFSATGESVGRPVDLEGRLDTLVATDGEQVYVQIRTSDGCDYAQVDMGAGRIVERSALPACIDDVSRLPDGRLVGVAEATREGDVPGDDEVVVVNPATVEMTPLTSGPYREEAAFTSADGRRVVFNRRLDNWPRDFDMRIYRRVVCWTDIPPR